MLLRGYGDRGGRILINKKYSYNGYDPLSPAVKQRKAELKFRYATRRITRKEYTRSVAEMKLRWRGANVENVVAN